MIESGVDALYALLPHDGRMRLIDTLVACDAERLSATAHNHRAANHPLRLHGRLHGLAALEYAAQACALHGVRAARLDSGAGSGVAVVATVQTLVLCGGDLDTAAPELQIDVHCVFRQRHAAIYDCRVHDRADWSLTASLGVMWN